MDFHLICGLGIFGYAHLYQNKEVDESSQIGGKKWVTDLHRAIKERKFSAVQTILDELALEVVSSDEGKRKMSSLEGAAQIIYHGGNDILLESQDPTDKYFVENLFEVLQKFREKSWVVEDIVLSIQIDQLFKMYQILKRYRGTEYLPPYKIALISIRKSLSELLGDFEQQNPEEVWKYLRGINRTVEAISAGLVEVDRKCQNELDPATYVGVQSESDLPSHDWIRLSSGRCWDINSLIGFIRGVSFGKNSTEGLRENYGSDYLWENAQDYHLIVNHQVAVADKLDAYIRDMYSGGTMNKISDETVRRLFRAGSVAWSRGPAWENVIASHPEFDEEMREEFNRLRSGISIWELPSELQGYENMPESSVNQIIENGERDGASASEKKRALWARMNITINNVIKGVEIAQLLYYYESLSDDEKMALREVNNDAIENLYGCARKDSNQMSSCVMITGDRLIRLYNEIVRYKSGFQAMNTQGEMIDPTPVRVSTASVPGLPERRIAETEPERRIAETESERRIAETEVIADSGIEPMISAGSNHSLALKTDGTVVAWDRLFRQMDVPDALENVIQISAGKGHSLALTQDGTVISWTDDHFDWQRRSDHGEFDGYIDMPDDVRNVTQISAGYNHSMALKQNGTIIVWKRNYRSVDGISVDLDYREVDLENVIQISAGRNNSLALTQDGTVVAWGDNYEDDDYGQNSVPVDLENVIQISAGYSHGLALKQDGTVVAWGDNSFGQTNVPVDLENVIQISAGYRHSLALKQDGMVIAWGDNSVGQTNVPVDLENVIQISAGENHNMALKQDGTIVAWGDNNYRQTNSPEVLNQSFDD